MSKKLCNKGVEINKKDKRLKYLCQKCNMKSTTEKYCCKPVKLKNSA
jgi:hypothetical protein